MDLFRLLISYLTRAKIFPKIYQALLPVPDVPELKRDTGRVLSEFLMLFTNVACPPHGRSPSTDDRRKRFRHPICNCRTLWLCDNNRRFTWNALICQLHSRLYSSLLNKRVPESTIHHWHGRTKESGIRYVLFHCLFAYKSVLHLVRLGSSGLKVSEIILGCICPMVLPNGEIGFYQRENRLKHIKAA